MKLDNEQQEAANYINASSLIIAGAGSGKTTTLIEKVNILVKSGINPSEIAVISFTNKAVDNFKRKCTQNINITTFHKFALSFLDKNIEIVDEEELNQIIIKYLENLNIKIKKKLFNIFNNEINFYSNEKYKDILNKRDSNSLFKNIKSVILICRTNKIDIKKINTKNYNKNEILLLYICYKISKIYQTYLHENNLIDFDTMIIKATRNINNGNIKSKYKHILIDEYQDISLIRLEFIKALEKSNNAIITAVGDDFQAIYGFSGSNIHLFYNFKSYFKNSKLFYIRTTYRCPQKIVTTAGKFVMRNKYQIKKELISKNTVNGKIKKIYTMNTNKVVEKIIRKKSIRNDSLLILSRNNYDFRNIKSNKIKFNDGYLYYFNNKINNCKYMTIHSAKGLEAQNVIIINLKDKFDSLPTNKENELCNKLINNDEKISFPEERRLFYVGLTRACKNVYLIVDLKCPSPFIKEI